jgi:DNA invertase Pin-like site-specific DNA recombinase
MAGEAHQRYLSRLAYLYVRQSTLRQVFENTESTHRQYALRERAVALGWPLDRIVVIDSDLGQSGATAADREGFQRLVTEVGLGRVGIVLGLEVSRLARNSTDWHRLLELCALGDTLSSMRMGSMTRALQRSLLWAWGTMSEAELHVLKARLRGGILSRARRGELKQMVPVGFVHDAQDRVILDPDAQVQGSVRLFFETFQRTGSCLAVVKEFHAKELLFPRRLRSGVHKANSCGPSSCTACRRSHNPRYAGAFVFGRKTPSFADGKYSGGAQRGVDPAARRASGLHYLGRVSVEPPTREEQCSRLERRAMAWTGTRRHGTAAGACDLWNLR